MKAIELLRELHQCGITKGKVYADDEVIEGELNPRATYYFTFCEYEVVHHDPDAILLSESGEKMYFFKIER